MNFHDLIPEPYRLLSRILVVLLVLLAVYATGRHQGAEHVRGQWSQEKATQLTAQAKAEQAARQREQAMIQQLQKAQYDAAERETVLRAAADAAAASAGQLRSTVADLRSRLSIATVEACRATAESALVVFSECTSEYRAVAAAADQHRSAAQTLSDAWPQ